MTKKLVMSIGLPFSGKSTLAENYRNQGYEIISRDEILGRLIVSDEYKNNLHEILGEKRISEHDHRATFKYRNEILIRMLNDEIKRIIFGSESENFFYDGTNIQKKAREGVIRLEKCGVDVEGIYLKVPIEEIMRRAEIAYKKNERSDGFNRESFLSLGNIINMLEEPDLSEGFNKLIIFDWLKETDREKSSEMKLR